MAGISYGAAISLTIHPKTLHGIRCSSSSSDNCNDNYKKRETSRFVRIAVSGVTELLRVFSPPERNRSDMVNDEQEDEPSASGVEEVLSILKSDYENAYFVTGIFTSSVYAEDCIFEDPTIRFQGKELYSRNLKLLVPFFDRPSIQLQNIEKGINPGTDFVHATWKLRTYLKLPWRPLISIDGSTLYELDNKFKIVRHAESWNVSVLEAIGQIFSPGLRWTEE